MPPFTEVPPVRSLRKLFVPKEAPVAVPEEKRSDPLPQIAAYLEVLASEQRLEILRRLREPHHLGEIRVNAVSDDGDGVARALSRQGVARHLDRLVQAGLVRKIPSGGDGRRGPMYVVARDRVFAMVDELRNLTRLRPQLDHDADLFATEARPEEASPRVPAGPRLLVAYGPDDRVVFPLEADGPWLIGRASDAHVVVDHDPFASAAHARLERGGGEWTLTDLGSRNGTWVNWQTLPEGEQRCLRSGDLLTVGRTQLVVQF